MQLAELFDLIQKTVVTQGFKLNTLIVNNLDVSRFVLADELEKRKVSEIADYQAFYGNCLEVRKCAHRNGSKEDTSYYMAIEDVDRSSFRDYKKIKLMRSQTEATLMQKIIKFCDIYKKYLEEINLERKLDTLLNLGNGG